MKGTLYSVGVGPGDPELMTLKALRLIRENDVIGVPGKLKEETVVYNIVKAVVEDIDTKTFIECHVQMTKDKEILKRNYDAAAKKITDVLETGKNVIFLNLGDPTIYGTAMYIHQRVGAQGFETCIVSGIPSFCAASARLNISLSERSEMMHVIPSSYPIDEALKLPGTKVLMKAAGKMSEVRQKLMALDADVSMVENCGMENERVFHSAEEIDEDAGYYSLIIVKEH